MANYRIEIKVRITPCDDEQTAAPVRQEDGLFTHVLSADQALSIDTCEQAVLATNFVAVRTALAEHFSAVSEARAEAVAQAPAEVRVKPYRVDGEAGRFTFQTHRVVCAGEVVYDTSADLFPALRPKEWYRTQGFKELALVYGVVDESFRKTQALLNRVRHQPEGGTPLRTLWDNAEAEGRQLHAYLEQLTAATLAEHGFTPAGTPPADADYDRQSLITLPAAQVTAALQACTPAAEWMDEVKSNPVPYEDPAHTVLVAIDEVGVKQQKAPCGGTAGSPAQPVAAEERKRVHHTVARIAQGATAYILTGHGVAQVLQLLLAFLLRNRLLRHNLVFFVDGQRSLHAAILQAFAWFAPHVPQLKHPAILGGVSSRSGSSPHRTRVGFSENGKGIGPLLQPSWRLKPRLEGRCAPGDRLHGHRGSVHVGGHPAESLSGAISIACSLFGERGRVRVGAFTTCSNKPTLERVGG